MDITPQDAFKLGFLARCAEERLTGAALDARLEKVAEFNKKAAGGKPSGGSNVIKFSPLEAGGGTASGALNTLWQGLSGALAIPTAASILGGGALGYGTAKMVEPNISEDDIKAQELAATYKMYAEKAKARRKLRNYRLGQN
jgi:hypothetical protein